MLVRVREGFGLVLFPKAAASAVTNALPLGWSEVSPEVFEPLSQRVAFMRDPYKRAVSAYRMFTSEGNSRHNISSFDAFIQSICRDDQEDAHVMSQVKLCKPAGRFLPTCVIRWDFVELARIIGVEVIPPANKSKRIAVKWSKSARDRFAAAYAKDVALWRNTKWTP